MENDSAAAVMLVAAERAGDFPHRSVYILGVASGSDHRCGAFPHNRPNYASASFSPLAPDLYRKARLTSADVGVVQAYENFTGGVLMSPIEHGLFMAEQANEFLQLDNLMAPGGRLPLNTSVGNLAECYMQGFELVLEAIRQTIEPAPRKCPTMTSRS